MQTIYHGESAEALDILSFTIQGIDFKVSRVELQLLQNESLRQRSLRAVTLESSLKWVGDRYINAARLPVYLSRSQDLTLIIALGEQTPGSYRAVLEGYFHDETDGDGYYPVDPDGKPPAYRLLKLVAEPKIQGTWPQIKDFISIRAHDRNYSRHHKTFLPEEIEMQDFKLEDRAKHTDFYSSNYLQANGFFVSLRMREILEAFNLGSHRYHDATIHVKGQPEPILFLQLLESEELDFSESRFLVNDRSGQHTDTLQAESLAWLHEKKLELINLPSRPSLTPTLLSLTQKLDLFKPPLTIDFVMSAALREKFREEKVSGIEYKALERYSVV